MSAEVWHNIAWFSFVWMAALPVAVQAVKPNLNWNRLEHVPGTGSGHGNFFLLSCFVVFKYPHLFYKKRNLHLDDPTIIDTAPGNPTARNGKPTDCTQCWEMGKCHVGRIAALLNHGGAIYCRCNPSEWLTQIDSYSFLSC